MTGGRAPLRLLLDRRRLRRLARAALRDPAPAAAVMPGRALRVALLGAGRHGGGRLLPALEALAPDVEVVRIVVRSDRSAAALAARGGARVGRDVGAAIAAAEVDAVVVALPPPLLAPAAAAARALGKHVLCETPGATGERDLALLSATEGPGRPLLAFTSPARFGAVPYGAAPGGTPAFTHHSLFHLADAAAAALGAVERVVAEGPGDFLLRGAGGGRARLALRPGTGNDGASTHADSLRAFVGAVRGGGPFPARLAEAAAAVRLWRRLRRARRAVVLLGPLRRLL